MILKEIEPLILEGKFQDSIEILLCRYSASDAPQRKILDDSIFVLQHWVKNLKKMKEAENPIHLWDEFIHALLVKNPSLYLPVLKPVTQFIMGIIYHQLAAERITPEDKNPFHKKLALARCLLWTGQRKAAFAFLSHLLRTYPHHSEPWALTGKIYFLKREYEKSLLFYRESFFINPSVLNLWDIKSNLTDRIALYYRENYQEKEGDADRESFLQWLGISGVTGGFFRVRRILSLEELKRLEKRIEVYENKYRFYQKKQDFLNLIRLYLFKVDYFISQNKYKQVSQTLQKLETYNSVVYKKIKTRG